MIQIAKNLQIINKSIPIPTKIANYFSLETK